MDASMDISGIPLVPLALQSGAGGGLTAPAGSAMAYWIAMGLVVGGVLIIAMVIVGVLRGRAKSAEVETEKPEIRRPANQSDLAPPPGATSLATVQEAEQLLRLMGEAEELCNRLSAQLDAKAREVEAILARADAAGRVSDHTREHQTTPDEAEAEVRGMPVRQAGLVSRPAVQPIEPVRTRAETPTRVEAPTRLEAPTIVTRPIAPAAPVMAAVAAVAGPALERHEGLDALANQVYTLADRGLSSQDIARTLREHPGKIELILALRTR